MLVCITDGLSLFEVHFGTNCWSFDLGVSLNSAGSGGCSITSISRVGRRAVDLVAINALFPGFSCVSVEPAFLLAYEENVVAPLDSGFEECWVVRVRGDSIGDDVGFEVLSCDFLFFDSDDV